MDISLYTDGEQATAAVLNRPLQQIKGAVDTIEARTTQESLTISMYTFALHSDGTKVEDVNGYNMINCYDPNHTLPTYSTTGTECEITLKTNDIVRIFHTPTGDDYVAGDTSYMKYIGSEVTLDSNNIDFSTDDWESSESDKNYTTNPHWFSIFSQRVGSSAGFDTERYGHGAVKLIGGLQVISIMPGGYRTFPSNYNNIWTAAPVYIQVGSTNSTIVSYFPPMVQTGHATNGRDLKMRIRQTPRTNGNYCVIDVAFNGIHRPYNGEFNNTPPRGTIYFRRIG